ncbi:1-acyl-sn-glycerol-3-phosphate acyltransferase [Hujiaoplasma nucleasis]|uniref:1-acyl-sn-glycerol-3-phosphate acyltransferase n=1 Tax=Hujiaoplasma nucleasis TaxID=2725268 RepID=A0A7L6N1V4_9MOLU|nr:lysophospholipid acyltransferase family protein [Hujiaoplasma nucleasis]QLY40236.1 1-acyl-sn-glycerol-3-phosphate acyltransferase [Hujiaoplasma nucleasis]
MATTIFFITYLFYTISLSYFVSIWFIPLWMIVTYPLGFLSVMLVYYLHIPIVLILKPTHPYKTYLLRSISFFLNKFIFGLDIEYKGQDNIPKDVPLVVYANHKSYSDAFPILQVFNRPITFSPKLSISRLPFISLYLRSYRAFFIDRKNIRHTAKSLTFAIDTIKSGMALIVFPEGSVKYREDETVSKMKAGSFKLALKSQANILPIRIDGLDRVRDNFPFKRTKRKVTILKAIPYEDYKDMSTIEIAKVVMDHINNYNN